MTPADYLPEARDDIEGVYIGYQGKAVGLGDRFLDALRRTVRAVEGNPRLFGEVAPGVRAATLRKFPQVVYYVEEAGRVLVVAVRHGRDDPAIWQGRV